MTQTQNQQGYINNPIAVSVFLLLFAFDAFLYWLQAIHLVVAGLGVIVAAFIASAIQIADQWEKGVVLRLGKFKGLRGPGLFLIIPIVDRVDQKIDQRIRVTDFNAEKTLTKDTVPVNVDAVVYWNGVGR